MTSKLTPVLPTAAPGLTRSSGFRWRRWLPARVASLPRRHGMLRPDVSVTMAEPDQAVPARRFHSGETGETIRGGRSWHSMPPPSGTRNLLAPEPGTPPSRPARAAALPVPRQRRRRPARHERPPPASIPRLRARLRRSGLLGFDGPPNVDGERPETAALIPPHSLAVLKYGRKPVRLTGMQVRTEVLPDRQRPTCAPHVVRLPCRPARRASSPRSPSGRPRSDAGRRSRCMTGQETRTAAKHPLHLGAGSCAVRVRNRASRLPDPVDDRGVAASERRHHRVSETRQLLRPCDRFALGLRPRTFPSAPAGAEPFFIQQDCVNPVHSPNLRGATPR